MSELARAQLTETAVLDSVPPSVLKRGLVGGAIVLAALEFLVPHLIRPWNKTTIQKIDDMGERDCVAFAGLGRRDALAVAKEAAPLLPNHRLHYVRYANHGVRSKGVGLALGAFYEAGRYEAGDGRGQTVVAHSMGHPTFLRGVEWLIKQGLYVPHIDKLIGVSIPRDLGDTSRQKEVNILLGTHYLGGTLTKMIAESIHGYQDRDEETGQRKHSLGMSAWRGMKAGFTGYHPWHYVRQLQLLKQASEGFEPGVFQDVLTSRTEVIIFDSELDTTVLRERAAQSHIEFFEPYGITPAFMTVPGMRHGDVRQAVAYYLKGQVELGTQLSQAN